MHCRNGFRNYLVLFIIVLTTGCAVHRFPVVRPVHHEFPLEEQSKQTKAQDYFIKARDYERRGLDQSAERYYEMAYELDPSSKILQNQVIRKYVESGKYSQALLLLKRDKKNSELDRENKRTISTIYLKMGEFAKAAEILESISDRSDEEIYSLGLIYESLNNVSKALDHYLQYYNQKPESVPMGFKIGRLLLSEKRFEEAESLFQVIRTANGSTPEVLTMLGTVKIIRGDTAAGLSYYESALEIDSTNEETLRSKAQIYLGKNSYPEAITCYEKLYAGGSYGEVYGRTLALLYYYNKQYSDAERILKKMLQELMDDYELHYYLGLVLSASARTEAARIEIEKSLIIRNTFEDAWRELCFMYVREKDYDKALSTAQRYTVALPTSASSWRMKGYVLNLRKEFSSSVDALNQSLKIDSTDVYTLFELGSALERSGQMDRASDAFRKVLALRPGDPAASNYLGYMWAEKGIKLDSAEVLIKTALEQEPENGAYLDSYAWVFFMKGELDSAYTYILKAVEKMNDDPVIYDHIGDILVKMNDYTGALEAYRRSLELKSEDAEKILEKISNLEILLQRNGK